MPKNVPAELEEKFASCKEKVIASGQTEEAAYGICYTSVVEGKSLPEATKSFYLDEAIKAPPEGHPFYGNQYLNFGGGASGGNAPRTVSEGENKKPILERIKNIPKVSVAKDIDPDKPVSVMTHYRGMSNFVTSNRDEQIFKNLSNAEENLINTSKREGVEYIQVTNESSRPSRARKSEDAMKFGRSISKANAEIIKGIVALAKQLVPDEEDKPEGDPEAEAETPEVEMPEGAMQPAKGGDLLISYGSAVKSLNGKLGGYAVRFGGQDLAGEGFSRSTNYGFAGENTKRVDILLHHAQPMATKSGASVQVTEPIGTATLRMVDDGIIVEDAILYTAEKYAKYLDKLGWSTGAAAHAVVRDGKTIKQWQIAEVSLTPFPAEPRNMVAAKSLAGEMVEEAIDYRQIGREVGAKIIQQLRVTAR